MAELDSWWLFRLTSRVHFSCKISNTFLAQLDRDGGSKDFLYEQLDFPVDFLRAPSYWLEAPKMEAFLGLVQRQGLSIESVVHRSKTLRAWGPLDSVLSMMKKPQDILAQPERFLSYFISPAPPVGNVRATDTELSFDIPISHEEYPRVTEYLRAAFESLPTYVGQNLAEARWNDNSVSIRWGTTQENLLEEQEDVSPLSNPKLVDSVIQTLEKGQKELEARNRELQQKNEELERAQREIQKYFKEKVFSEKLSNLSELSATISHEISNPITYVLSNVQRLNDYMARATQLVTLLAGKERLSPQVQEAMRRVDWKLVQSDFPDLIQEAIEGIHRVQDIVNDLASWAGTAKKDPQGKVPTDLNDLVARAIRMIEPKKSGAIEIDRHLFMDRPVSVYPLRLEQALLNVLSNSIQSIEDEGRVRISTRPKGSVAEIEVSDTGRGLEPDELKNLFSADQTLMGRGRSGGLGLAIVQSVVEMHDGRINVESSKGRGSTFRIELPL